MTLQSGILAVFFLLLAVNLAQAEQAASTNDCHYIPPQNVEQQPYQTWSPRSRRNQFRQSSTLSQHYPSAVPYSQRGGAAPAPSTSAALVKPSTSTAIVPIGQAQEETKPKEDTSIEKPPPINFVKPSQISSQVDEVRAAAKKWKRKEFFALLLARLTFCLALPLSAVLTVLTLAISIIVTLLRVLTFNFCLKESSRIMYAVTKALFATSLASLAGIMLPVFAIFGWIAAVAEAAIEMAEPLLRIRYQRQLKKLRHLQTILTDPVLMETLEYLVKGAEAVSKVTAHSVEVAGQNIGKASVNAGKASVRGSRFALRASKKAAEAAAQQVQDSSVQLVETLLSSPEVQQLKERVNTKMPSRMQEWTQDQWESLRKSGVLEDAARAALTALKKELSTAARFMPYLEAIKEVRDKQAERQGSAL